MIQVTDTIVLNDREVEERFVRATGPGGQKVEQGIGSISLNPNVAIATAVRVAEAEAKAAVGATKR